MTVRFQSFLTRPLESFLEFKTALGYSNYGSATTRSIAKSFDDFVHLRGTKSFDGVTDRLVQEWVRAVRQNSAKTKNKYLKFAKQFFDYLLRQGTVADNPARKIRELRESTYRPYIFTIKELHDILAAAERLRDPRTVFPCTMATIFHLLYACALRLGESTRLRIRDVDFEQNLLSLWKTKFHKERVVPFSEPTARRLGAYLVRRTKAYPPADDQAPFFAHMGKQVDHLLILKSFHKCLQAVGVPNRVKGGARLHDLRHTAAVHRLYKWYQEGHNPQNKIPLLSTFMGHRDVAHTQVYLTISRDLLREGDKRFQASFEDLVKKRLPADDAPR